MGSKHLLTNSYSKNKNRKAKPKVKLYHGRSGGSAKNEDEEINNLKSQYNQVVTSIIKTFKDIPLSHKTQKGLKDNNYVIPTEIQRESICIALRGLDVLGAAKTGSGKTLAFLIPVLEHLYCKKWTRLDGLGALIITPTRELAFQIFEMLRKVGHHHDFSAGLIIGGKDLHFEKKRMDQCNIVICTPGRLLQHMDENPLFSCDNMQILILDEADRCLDLGFEKTMNSIIEHLPPKRQTLLFSATQTKSVRDLARLSLKNPTYVSVHENAVHSTPEALRQSYTVVDLHDKMSVLWSFIRSHLKHKIIVFFSSCKQVKYHFEALCRLRPGTSLLALYGSLHQLRRMEIYRTFCGKTHAVLLSTDLAARGLDFPEVDWVVQMDCPEDSATYIHRVGRTARYEKGGEAILVLTPSEETAMLTRLESARIPIENIKINPNKLQSPQRKLEALLARDPNLKESAQRAFVAYLKSVFLMSDKQVFNINAYDTDAYARSLGLAIPPRIRFLQKYQKAIAKQKDENEESTALLTSSLENTSDYIIKKEDCFEEDSPANENCNDTDSDDEILHLRRKNHELEDYIEDNPIESTGFEHQGINTTKSKKKIVTKAAIAKKIIKKKIIANKKTVFDDEGEVLVDGNRQKLSEIAKKYEEEVPDKGGIDLEQAKKVLEEEDRLDKQRERERVKAKHREEKRKLKNAKNKSVDSDQEETKVQIVLSGNEDESSSDGPDLSWLPDPDKVYGEKQDDDTSSNNSVSECTDNSEDKLPNEDIECEYSNLPMKRKCRPQKKNTKRPKKDQMEEVCLKDDEDLALRFLRNSSH